MSPYRGAVLIVGSLWWDQDDIRENWRQSRLDLGQAIKVIAPIRYGRMSGEKRKHTYTMVFSTSCYEEQMGKGILIPFAHTTTNLMDLICEAQRLWEAEGGIAGRIAGKWGAVGLLVNPQIIFPNELIDGWKTTCNSQKYQPKFAPIGTERTSFNDGMLTLEWVRDALSNQPVDFDFILAIATDPEVVIYPTPEQIAQACNDNNYQEYFRNNRLHGITTFQDTEIENLLVHQS